MPKLVRFGERQHVISQPTSIRVPTHPLVAICGTVFVPKTFDPDPEMDKCLGCTEMQAEIIRIKVDELVLEHDKLIDQLDEFNRSVAEKRQNTKEK